MIVITQWLVLSLSRSLCIWQWQKHLCRYRFECYHWISSEVLDASCMVLIACMLWYCSWATSSALHHLLQCMLNVHKWMCVVFGCVLCIGPIRMTLEWYVLLWAIWMKYTHTHSRVARDKEEERRYKHPVPSCQQHRIIECDYTQHQTNQGDIYTTPYNTRLTLILQQAIPSPLQFTA